MGGFFALVIHPGQARAGFFSSIIKSNEARADTTRVSKDLSSNSQSMTLLQANVLPESTPVPQKGKEVQIDENKDISIVSDNALQPATGPVGVSDGSTDESRDPSVYVVRKGDAISAIAKMFGVSENTIRAANDLKKGDKLVEGDVLFILPISGLEHIVKKGETLAGIAKLYKIDANDIVAYNDINIESSLTAGDKLMIPGAEMADEGGDKPVANLKDVAVKDKNYYAAHPAKGVSGYFIDPAPAGVKTQGLHGPGHRGIDIGAPTGTPIYAAASGTILIAKTGWSGGYGNMLIIQHPNGTKTLYAHMSSLASSTGEHVTQGKLIGYVGSTGHSTGPHLHFEVFGAKNPGSDWSWSR